MNKILKYGMTSLMAFAICLTANAGKKITKIEFSDQFYIASYNSNGNLDKLRLYDNFTVNDVIFMQPKKAKYLFAFSYPENNTISLYQGPYDNEHYIHYSVQFNPTSKTLSYTQTRNTPFFECKYEVTPHFAYCEGKITSAVKWNNSSIIQLDEFSNNNDIIRSTYFKYSSKSYNATDWSFDWLSFIVGCFSQGESYTKFWYCNKWFTPFSKLPKEISAISNNGYRTDLKLDYHFHKDNITVNIKSYVNGNLKYRNPITIYFE